MPDDLTPLEREVMTTLLAPDHPVMEALRRQLEVCRVAEREFTGVGFFSTLVIAARVAAAPVTRERLALGDVAATIDGLEHGAGFVLFVRDGDLEMLEGFSYDEPWPDRVTGFRVTTGGIGHYGGSETDLQQVEAALDRFVTNIDLDNPHRAIQEYFNHFRRLRSPVRADRLEAPSSNALDDWLFGAMHNRNGPADEALWPIVVAMVEDAPDEAALATVAAGPLEDLASFHGAQFGDRLVDKTRTDPRFRIAMDGILAWDRVPEPYRGRLLALIDATDGRRPSTSKRPSRCSGRDHPA
jgi:hypothetical protein